jgi:uncharacterized protein YyaL (SSP411 family)
MTEDLSQAGTNRLAGESSPYLRLHAHNPVDWHPWGEEALEKARREEKPIFLSVGYSTCFWCHVMERESFSSAAIAELMNRDFVNVKVDREERPDLDEIYMAATQVLTGQGGWPNSVFLTPQLRPFFAGTYFPPEDRHGRPGFPALLAAVAEAWRSRRGELEEQAEEVAAALRRYLEERGEPGAGVPPPEVAERSLAALGRRFDRRWGGFGSAPKFPTPSNLWLLQDLAGEAPEAAAMLAATLDQMACGGIHDQLAGGFHRYSTDREWRVPHFEKMLYDNALLLEVYAREHARTGDPEAARVARRTAEFLERELGAPEGGFWSAIDAETGGEEGAYYVWHREEIVAVLGEEDAGFLAPLLGFSGPPSFEGDRHVLHLPQPLAELAAQRRMTREELLAQIEPLRARLLAARGERPRPATDDKVLADWTGMAIAGFAAAGRALGDATLLERAARAADFALSGLRPAGRPLRHSWRAGEARVDAFLADYAYLVRGLLALHAAAGVPRWLDAAADLAAEQDTRLADPLGGWHMAAERDDLLFRTKEIFDGATPAANAVAVLNALELAERGAGARFRSRAEAALRAFAPQVDQQVEAARTLALAARRFHRAGRPAESPAAAPVADAVVPELEVGAAAADGWRPFRLRLRVAPGWHVAAPVEIGGEGAALRRVVLPPGDVLLVGGEETRVYSGAVEVAGELAGPAGSTLRLRFQACDDRRCLPPAEAALPVS